MKKQLIILSALLMAAFFTTTAQNNSIAFNDNSSSLNKSSIATSGISDVVLKRFKQNYPSVTDEAWQITTTGYIVRFTLNGIQSWAYLTRKGICEGQMRCYTQAELSRDVYKQVRSTYYDYSITLVKEITYKGTVAYLITIEDKSTWKVVHIVDGEMAVIEEHTKDNGK